MNVVEMGHLEVLQGGVYSLLVARDPKDNVHIARSYILTEPNSINILWLVTQYFVITAPESMKSVSQACSTQVHILLGSWKS